MSAASFTGWAVDAMIASTLLMTLVLLVRAPARRAFGSRVAYALWLLPLLRLILPPLPSVGQAAAAPIRQASEALVVVIEPATEDVIAAAPSAWPTIGTVLGCCWLMGSAAFLLFYVVAHLRACRRIRAAATSSERRGRISVIVSDAAPGPIAFGVWRRFVALPGDVAERYDADERALALAHELSHHRRGDLIANWVALVVLALHWFNPVAWRAFRAFRADQELANDACVLAGRSRADRHAYATAILKTAHGRSLSAACHLHTIADLKGRLKMLATSPASRRRLATGGAAVAALLVGGLAITASGTSAAAITAEVRQVAAVPAVPPVPSVPAVAAAPEAPEAPPASPAPAAPHRVKHVVIVRDGHSASYDAETPEARAALAHIPDIRSTRCGIDGRKDTQAVIESGTDAKRRIVICTDRIERMAADASAKAAEAATQMADAGSIERDAYSRALTGLLDARTKVAADVGITEADRTRSLAAIDLSIAEMKSQLAHAD